MRSAGGERLAIRVVAGILIGVVIGVTTSFAQARLDQPWAALANSASPWLLGAYAAGAVQVRRGVAVGIGLAACVAEVAAYYLTSAARGYAVIGAYGAFWAVCAVVGGPLFGWAGWAWRRETGRARVLGASILPATFVAEAVGAYVLRLHYRSAALLYLVLGLVLLAAVAWPVRRLGPTVLCTVLVALPGIIVYGPLLAVAAGGSFTA